MDYTNELRVIDTQEKAYLLGQIYGDGFNGCVPCGYKFTMASINTDLDTYTRLANLFPFLKLKTYTSHDNMIYLECYQKALCLDLKEHGMISNKTDKDKTGEFHFPSLREDLIPHFVRGYFDADGSAWYPTRERSRNNLRIEFGCATKNFLLALKDILDKNGIGFTYTERSKRGGDGKYHVSYGLFSSRRELSLRFADFIYKDATIYLPYKYEKCYRKPIYRPTATELYGTCPYCGGTNFKRSGIRAGKQRLYCVDCDKRFTRPLPN